MIKEIPNYLGSFYRRELLKRNGIEYSGKYTDPDTRNNDHSLVAQEWDPTADHLTVYHGSHLTMWSIRSILQEGFKTSTGQETFSNSGAFGGDAIRFARQFLQSEPRHYGVIFAWELHSLLLQQTSFNPNTTEARYSIRQSYLSIGRYYRQEIMIPPEFIKGCWLIDQDNSVRDIFFLGRNADDILSKITKLSKMGLLSNNTS